MGARRDKWEWRIIEESWIYMRDVSRGWLDKKDRKNGEKRRVRKTVWGIKTKMIEGPEKRKGTWKENK